MRFARILFDLDGTLSESGPGITKSAQYALHKMGIEEPDAGKLTYFAGPPLNLTFRKYYGMNDEETSRAVRFFQERYNREGLFETRLYPGIKDMLEKLSARLSSDDEAASGASEADAGSSVQQRVLVIASSKPEPLVRQVLQYLGIEQYFQVIVGSDPSEEADNKAGADNKQRMIAKALEVSDAWLKSEKPGNKEISLSETAMAGDRHFDIEGAKKNHITAVGVSYGYGSEEELQEAGADYTADSVSELTRYLTA